MTYTEQNFEEHIEAHWLATDYRTALISASVTGKVDVREWRVESRK